MTGKHIHHGKSSKDILDAEEVLKAAGLKGDDTFLDAGCGEGYISIEASRVVGENGIVYALDVYPESIETVKKKAKDRNLNNVEAVVADITESIDLDEASVDTILMANVLHGFVEEGEVDRVMKNIVKVLKPGGIFAVVEFRKVESSRGPPFNVRISPEDVVEILEGYGFSIEDSLEIGEYHYIVNGCKTLK